MIGPIKVSRSLKELNVKIKEIQREYLVKKGKELSILEISKILKVSKEEIAMAQEAQMPLESVDEENYNEKNGETKIARISSGKNEEQILVDKLCLNELINNLDKRERQIIILRYFQEKTQAQVAKMIGISQVQISRIEKKILKSMKQKIVNS